MNLTELLITAYSGDDAVFTANPRPLGAATSPLKTDSDGDAAVQACSEHATPVFDSMARVLRELMGVSS
jgi:hypothetical protein